MAERQPSKASEVVDDLMQRPLTPEEIAKRYPKVEDLRLRADAPVVEIDDTTPVKGVIDRLAGEDAGIVAVREAGVDSAVAVVLPIERYLELAGKELAGFSSKVATLDGRLVPVEEAFATSHVEQADPDATWAHDTNTVR